jgi:hypothetical protein
MSHSTMEKTRELETELYRGTLDQRLEALGQLCAQLGPHPHRGTNCHIHTSESFSVFRSPSEAVWQAAREGLAVLGINDHYTIAGHEEFRLACQVAGISAAFSLEAVAMDRESADAGLKLNDPDNPGRIYLCGKGISRVPEESSDEMLTLTRMRGALERRNREMTSKVAALFMDKLGADGPTWKDVVALTPRGNATERHLAYAVLLRLRDVASQTGKPFRELLAALCPAPIPASDDDATMQIFIRGKLLKAGGLCYVAEGPDAFVSVANLRKMFLAFGAIPTYPILGNPILDGEKNIEALLDSLGTRGFYAVEVIPVRNTRERLREIVTAAQKRWWPVFNGTEHNTPETRPMLDPFALDPEFEPWFRRSAALMLGHQKLVAQGQPGFVDSQGRPTIEDAKARFEKFNAAGG